ncbi:MAG: tetratricopeptide repeat protein [Chloroherpetonaceae bacterium]|nr:tetratricopeptide repeat protein [Chloroherpetonaceae bacterium]MDW8437162.1 tetratricopeptide repeat protein [Chloroherpetonaceae bacterium]
MPKPRPNDRFRALFEAGKSLYEGGKFKDAVVALQEVATLLKPLSERRAFRADYVLALHYLASSHLALYNHSDSLPLLNECLEHYRALNQRQGEFDALCDLGVLYERLGAFDVALDYHFKSLDIAKRLDSQVSTAKAYNNIGSVYYGLRQYDEAREFYLKSLALKEKLSDKKSLALTQSNLSSVYSSQGKHQEALELRKKVLAIRRELGDKTGECIVLRNLGSSALRLKNFQSARRYFFQSLKLAEALDDRRMQAVIHHDLGDFFAARREHNKAKAHLCEALKLAETLGLKPRQCDVHLSLSLLFKSQKKYAKSLRHYEAHHRLREEIFNEESDRRLKNLQVLNQLAEAQREAEKARVEKRDLEREVAQKSAEIARSATFLLKQTHLLEHLATELQHVVSRLSGRKTKDRRLLEIIADLQSRQSSKQELDAFQSLFNQLHPNFIRRLSERSPSLTPAELIVCSLIRLGLSSKDIAKIFYAADASGNRHRNIDKYRLHIRKKLGLTKDTQLFPFLSAV